MAFATHGDVAGQWRPLSKVEQTRATALLDMAAILIRRRVDLTDLAEDDEKFPIAKQVSIEMVIEALAPGAMRGRASYSVTLDDAAESATLLNPSATLVLTAAMLDLFGVVAGTGRPTPRGYFGDGPR